MSKPKDGGRGHATQTMDFSNVRIRNGVWIANLTRAHTDPPPASGAVHLPPRGRGTRGRSYSLPEIGTTPMLAPAGEVFTADELAARIARHAERVSAELQRLEPPQERQPPARRTQAGRKEKPVKRAADMEKPYPDTLRMCNCSRCGRELLAPGQQRETWYPPEVAGRVYGKPACAACLPHALREAAPPVCKFGVGGSE